MDIHFTLTIDESNLMLIALSKLPYEHVAPLIDKLKTQAAEQLAPPAPASNGKEAWKQSEQFEQADGVDVQG